MSAILGPAQSRSLIREKLDGTDVWESLISNKESPRKEMLYNFDPFFGDNKFGTGNRTKSVALRFYFFINGSFKANLLTSIFLF